MKLYPPGQITPLGAEILLSRVEPLVIYNSSGDTIQWYMAGGMEPMPGVQEGAVLADGLQGMHPPFTFVEHKGARQHGTTTQATVFDPSEFDMKVEFTVPPNYSNPEIAASAIRRVIREWIASWEPSKPGTMIVVTPDMGKWYCNPRLYRSPPDAQFRQQGKRLRQTYTWTVRNDDAFWYGTDSVSDFTFDYFAARDQFTRNDGTTLGLQWHQTYSGAATDLTHGYCATDGNQARWYPIGTTAEEVVNRFLGINEVQTISLVPPAGTLFTGGTFVVSFGGFTTTGIAWNASATTVQTALRALTSIGAGNVNVTGPNGGPWTVTFVSAKGFAPQATMTANGASLTPGGTTGSAVIGTSVDGMGPNSITDNQVITVKLGDPFNWPPSDQRIDIWARLNTNDASPTGIKLEIGQNFLTLYAVNAGVKTRIPERIIPFPLTSLLIPPLWNETFRLVVGTDTNAREYKLYRENVCIKRWLETTNISTIGSSNRGGGFGMRAGNAGVLYTHQDVPATITEWSMGDNGVVTESGTVYLTNIGDQDAHPRYLCYGPGTFYIGNGPNNTTMIKFGPLADNQIALLTTLPRLRGVVDLSPDQPEQDLAGFQDFVNSLISLATNNNVPPLLEWFESLLGIRPPQGELYSLLSGRFTNPVPAKQAGVDPVPQPIAVKIEGGNVDSKIVAALTPTRRWPE